MPRRAAPPSAPSDTASPRLTRQVPARAAPIRTGWSNRADLGAPRPSDMGPADHLKRSINDAVQIGYQVIDDNLRHGREAAQRFAASPTPQANVYPELAQGLGRMLELAGDLTRVWLDLAGGLLADPKVAGALERAMAPEPNAPPAMPATQPMADLVPAKAPAGPLVIQCDVRGHSGAAADPVTIDRRDAPQSIHLGPLRARQNDLPDIIDVALLRAVDGRGARAVITVPHDQPSGIYNGQVLAGDDDHVVGHIRLVIRP